MGVRLGQVGYIVGVSCVDVGEGRVRVGLGWVTRRGETFRRVCVRTADVGVDRCGSAWF